MSDTARRLATWDDLSRTPDDGRVYDRGRDLHYWILDPAERTLEAFEAQDGRWLRFGATDGDTPRVAPFDAIELDVAGVELATPCNTV